MKDKLPFWSNSPFGGRLKYKDHIEKYLSSLPDQFSYEELENIARRMQKKNTTNNDLGWITTFTILN